MFLFYAPIGVAFSLGIVAGLELLVRRHPDWQSSSRICAQLALVFLFASGILGFALVTGHVAHAAPSHNPVPAMLVIFLMFLASIVSLAAALVTRGAFRWLAAAASIVILAWVVRLVIGIRALAGLR